MFIKSSKQAYAKLMQSRQSLTLASLATASAATPLLNTSNFAFRTSSLSRKPVMGTVSARAFSGSLPEHIVLEMPNLSPTMEKVRRCEIAPNDIISVWLKTNLC